MIQREQVSSSLLIDICDPAHDGGAGECGVISLMMVVFESVV